jgi:glyoxylase-like metal-dependent hydrolase (beta-lactamase superfamily II)
VEPHPRDPDPDGVVRVRASNSSFLSLDGTNSYVMAGWVVDPGPDDPVHLDALVAAAEGRIEGIVLTHDHSDHSEGAEPLSRLAGGAPVVRPAEGDRAGPFTVLATPGHTANHVCLVAGGLCFTGDTVLGAGSVFIQPGEGSLVAYLESLRRLRALDLEVLCPGHGPYVHDPKAKLDEYLNHRLDRERKLVEGIAAGARTTDELLDAGWSEVPQELRGVAAITLEAHLEKLEAEDRLPAGVERLRREEPL